MRAANATLAKHSLQNPSLRPFAISGTSEADDTGSNFVIQAL
jgi:hypothetical protein